MSISISGSSKIQSISFNNYDMIKYIFYDKFIKYCGAMKIYELMIIFIEET